MDGSENVRIDQPNNSNLCYHVIYTKLAFSTRSAARCVQHTFILFICSFCRTTCLDWPGLVCRVWFGSVWFALVWLCRTSPQTLFIYPHYTLEFNTRPYYYLSIHSAHIQYPQESKCHDLKSNKNRKTTAKKAKWKGKNVTLMASSGKSAKYQKEIEKEQTESFDSRASGLVAQWERERKRKRLPKAIQNASTDLNLMWKKGKKSTNNVNVSSKNIFRVHRTRWTCKQNYFLV